MPHAMGDIPQLYISLRIQAFCIYVRVTLRFNFAGLKRKLFQPRKIKTQRAELYGCANRACAELATPTSGEWAGLV